MLVYTTAVCACMRAIPAQISVANSYTAAHRVVESAHQPQQCTLTASTSTYMFICIEYTRTRSQSLLTAGMHLAMYSGL
jgi:hypothetical protein